MGRSQRHKVIVQQTDSSGKGLSEKQPAPRYINQYANSQTFTVPVGPSGGPLQGSSMAGFPPTLIPPPSALDARDAELHAEGDFTDPGQFNLSGNPIYEDLPAPGTPLPPEPGSEAPTIASISPASGEVGTTTPATIMGVGFTEDSEVQQDGTAIVSTWVADDQIDATIPGSIDTPGPVQITVVNANGTSNEFPFDVVDAPLSSAAGQSEVADRTFPMGPYDLASVDDVSDKLLFRIDGQVDVKAEDTVLIEATGNTTVNGSYTVNTVALTNGQTVIGVDNANVELANSIVARGRLTVMG